MPADAAVAACKHIVSMQCWPDLAKADAYMLVHIVADSDVACTAQASLLLAIFVAIHCCF